MARGLESACSYGGFRLSKFISTSLDVLKAIDRDKLAKNLTDVDFTDNKVDPLGSLKERALGVAWDIKRDCFIIKTTVESVEPVTKRSVLSKLSQLYDPLGIVAPFTIVARVLFRTLTQEHEDWDQEVKPDLASKWKEWCLQLQDLALIQVPRCYSQSEASRERAWQLHAFCDASQEAYAVVIYLREEEPQLKDAEVAFVYGKARVSPPKLVTIPRLELVAAKLAADAINMVHRELEIEISKRVIWSDSMTVLKYLRNKNKRFDAFVTNRIQAILSTTEVHEWRYVPTMQNPADIGSRGTSASKLNDCSWLKGPQFLKTEEQNWPAEEADSRSEDVNVASQIAATATQANETSPLHEWLEHYSSMHRLRLHAAVWRRFKCYLQSRRTKTEKGVIVVKELREAEQELIAWEQRDTYVEETEMIKTGKPLPRKSTLYKLAPKFGKDDRLLVMQSRTRKDLPIVPPGKLAELLVTDAHVGQAHLGRQSTAAEALRKHWIIGLGRIVRRVVHQCQFCKNRRAKPAMAQMAPLPDIRLNSTFAFQNTGVDYFGPFLVRQGGALVKAYGVIFTCAATRAVHLEMAESLSTSSFLNALRRFICRRGQVQNMVSDNGTNFTSADRLLKKELRHIQSKYPEIVTELRKRSIHWAFNAPSASHHGGFFERLIRSIRRILTGLLDNSVNLTPEALATLLCECEAIMNARPLTPVSDEADDLEALTPNHLLIGRQGGEPPPRGGHYRNVVATLKTQWKIVQHLATTFWKRWYQEYRCLLHARTKWHQKTNRTLKENDVVIVVDPIQPREHWKLGRVLKTYPSKKDGYVRVVDVKTQNGIIKRPITKLCVLEAAGETPIN